MVHNAHMPIALSPISGPDCGRSRPIVGLTAVGRAVTATVQIDDPRLAAHHLIIDPARVLTALDAVTTVLDDDELHIRVGSSRLLISHHHRAVQRRASEVVVRRPRRVVTPASADEVETDSVPVVHATGLMMSVVALIGSAMIALITGSWMFMAFGAIGVMTSGAGLLIDRVKSTRRRSRKRRELAEAQRCAERSRRQFWPVDLVERADSVDVWSQRACDSLSVTVGVSDLTDLLGSPRQIPLDSSRVIALRAERSIAAGALRSIVAQVLIARGPADLDVTVDPALIDELPGVDDRMRAVDDDRLLLIITADVASLIHADSPVRLALESDRPTTCLCLVAVADSVPAVCTDVIDIGSDWSGVIDGREGIDAVDVAGMTRSTFAAIMDRLAGLVDPEDPDQHRRRIPDEVVLESPADGPADLRSAVAVLGTGADGPVTIDLVADGPHALVAGTTGSGKSELLKTLITSLCLRHDSDTCTFLLIDHKGGAAFDALASLPQVVGVVTDLDGGLVDRVLQSLEAEVRRREVLLRLAGVADLIEMTPGEGTPARLVIVVDEFAALASIGSGSLSALVDIARRGRSLGIHLVLATQRPAGVIDDAVRANTDIRIALRLQDRADALDVIGDDRAARLDRRRPGRAMVRLGGDAPIEFQTAVTLRVPLAECANRTVSRQLPVPHRPWADPLPELITEGIGLIDAFDEQRHRPLSWDPADGNLALVGAIGSGTTSALITLATACGDAAIYLLDGRGDPRLTRLVAAGIAAPIVAIRDRERVARLLRQVASEVETRRGLGVLDAPLVLMIDGVAEVMRSIDTSARDDLERILEEGPAVGVVTVTAGGPARHDLHASTTWLFHLDDSAEAQRYGLRADRVPPAIPGRIVDVRSGLQAQLAIVEPSAGHERLVPPAIGVLPERVSGVAGERTGRSVMLRIGQAASDMDDLQLEVPDGEHVMVVGPARSGRTTALDTLTAAWVNATGGYVSRLGRGGRLDEVPIVAGPHLVAVDDASSIDDVDGAFTNRLEAGEPGLMVIAAGHGDALRSRFGHWTSVVRRSRRGLVLAAAGDGDGDLLSASLPIRSPIPPRPGLAWVCVDGRSQLAQIATCEAVAPAAMLER